MNSIGGNANYTHIQAHGTPSAFEPGWIAQAGSVGPDGDPQSSAYKVIDVVVDVTNAQAGDFFILGTPIPLNCVVVGYTVDGENSIQAGSGGASTYTIGFAEATGTNGTEALPGSAVDGVGFTGAVTAGGIPGAVGESINGGTVNVVPTTFTTGSANIPVVYVDSASASTTSGARDKGAMRVKLIILCP